MEGLRNIDLMDIKNMSWENRLTTVWLLEDSDFTEQDLLILSSVLGCKLYYNIDEPDGTIQYGTIRFKSLYLVYLSTDNKVYIWTLNFFTNRLVSCIILPSDALPHIKKDINVLQNGCFRMDPGTRREVTEIFNKKQ